MKIKAIIKRPEDEYGRMTLIENTLENLQMIVRGYIETTGIDNLVIICNEEGKLRGLEDNIRLGNDTLKGTIIICGASGDEFSDVPVTMQRWMEYIDKDSRIVG